MSTERKYDDEFKRQAVKLAKEVGTKAAVAELCVPKSTLLAWVRNANNGLIDMGFGTRTSEESLNLAQQLQAANKHIKEIEKKNRELEELGDSPFVVGNTYLPPNKAHAFIPRST